MSKTKFFITIFIIGILAATSGFLVVKYLANKNSGLTTAAKTIKSVYYCPMHPSYTSNKPGDCPICGMKLVKKEDNQRISSGTVSSKPKILYYRNPMNPQATSPVPMKDEMGMDYVPVYEEIKGASGLGVYISQEKQQLIGVKKEQVSKRHLTYEIRSVGKIAYDPDLYIAQEEYLQALKTIYSTDGSTMPLVKEQVQGILNAAEQRLLLLGMNKSQIEDLVQKGKPEENLYFPQNSDKVWVYISIYEYEMGLIKEGLSVEVDAVAFPGEVFKGKVMAITPVLDNQTRSARVRAEIENPGHKFKPEMFVNAKIEVDLGEKLAVPETAVLDTGIRKIVYLAKEGDTLEAQEVTLGQKSGGFYEVLGGLKEGDMVVTSGNFLVDSESKLKGALQGH
jgi:Cu(I)/Ag(I) efflux system membrane fusion protein